MDERMTIEKTLSVIDRSIRTLREAGYPAQADELTEARVPVSAHLTQPAQAVDVATAMESWHVAYCEICEIEGNTTEQRIHRRASAVRKWMDSVRPDRAIGNAQAEGWPSKQDCVDKFMATDADGLTHFDHLYRYTKAMLTAQATPNAHE